MKNSSSSYRILAIVALAASLAACGTAATSGREDATYYYSNKAAPVAKAEPPRPRRCRTAPH